MKFIDNIIIKLITRFLAYLHKEDIPVLLVANLLVVIVNGTCIGILRQSSADTIALSLIITMTFLQIVIINMSKIISFNACIEFIDKFHSLYTMRLFIIMAFLLSLYIPRGTEICICAIVYLMGDLMSFMVLKHRELQGA